MMFFLFKKNYCVIRFLKKKEKKESNERLLIKLTVVLCLSSWGNGDYLQLALTHQILDIINIDDDNNLFHVSFNIKLRWTDYRLRFTNVRKNWLQPLTREEQTSIWKPSVILFDIFQNRR